MQIVFHVLRGPKGQRSRVNFDHVKDVDRYGHEKNCNWSNKKKFRATSVKNGLSKHGYTLSVTALLSSSS